MIEARIPPKDGVSPVKTIASPLSLLHPSRISAALDQRLTPATVRRLQDCRRLDERIAMRMQPALMQQDLWPIPAAAEFLAIPADPLDIARRAGAVWHAASLRLVVTGKAAAELVAAIGEKAVTFGLRHAAAAVATARITGPSDLAEAIECHGLACLGAWLVAEPKPRRDTVLLRLSAENAERTRRFPPDQQTAFRAVMAVVMTDGDFH